MQVWTWITLRVYLLFFYIVFYWDLSSIFQQGGRNPDITIVEGVWRRTEVFLLPLILNVGFLLSGGTEPPSGRGAPQQAHLHLHLKHLNRLKSERRQKYSFGCVWELSSLLCADTSSSLGFLCPGSSGSVGSVLSVWRVCELTAALTLFLRCGCNPVDFTASGCELFFI